jgi:hypothetical protein
VYYQAVSAGLLPLCDPSYDKIGRLLAWGREEGKIPFSMIVDNVRATNKPSSWSGLSDYGGAVRASYRKDLWRSMPDYLAFFCEKDAISGVLAPTTREYDVPLHVLRGYCSVSFAGQIAEEWTKIEKPIYCYFFGDHDPSGRDLERDLRDKLRRYSGRQFVDADVAHFALCDKRVRKSIVIWERLGVRETDFDDFNLIKLPVKKKDRRAKKFVEAFGPDCAEVDAIPATELRHRVREAIEDHIDQETWQKLKEIEALEKETLEKMILNLGAA